jgi:hypothetical protein
MNMSSKIKMLEQELVIERRKNQDLHREQQEMRTSIKFLTEEKNSLERDKTWLKSLTQNLTEIFQHSDVRAR